jgi:hypothetical protein
MGLAMKAISIRQPWAWAILHAGKRIENRAWRSPPSYRGPLLIHAAKACTGQEYDAAADFMVERGLATPFGGGRGTPRMVRLSELPFGALLGIARLVDARPNGTEPTDLWAIPGALGLVLDDVRPLPVPIPWRGQLGLFDVPDSVLSLGVVS